VTLRNPERDWLHAPTAAIDRDEVERRIGPTSDALELLSGGLSNRNIRVGRDRVLRLFRGLDPGTIFRDASTVGKEAALASRDWRSFRTPKVLERGPDFLLYEYVEHTPLSDAHGAAVGAALAEIHAIRYPTTGLLGEDLALVRPPEWGPAADDELTPRSYGHSQLAEVRSIFDVELSARLAAFFDSDPLAARNAVDVPVLTHSDFKASNVHWAASGMPLVLDWELAWSGSRYIDIGQILRWHPPETFVRDFASAYVGGGGLLADDWRRFAETVDLCSLIGLYRHPEARSTDALLVRILETLDR
jgi:hypothetical protein